MINKKVILLAPFKYYYQNRLTKYIKGCLTNTLCTDLHFYKPLQKIFTQVIGYDYLERLAEIGITGINQEVIDLVKKEHPDYVIQTSNRYEFQESTFDAIRKEGTVAIGFFYDDEYYFEDYSKWWAPHFDYCVTNDIEAVSKYRKIGAKCILRVPIIGGVAVKRDWSKIEEKHNVSFIGHKEHGRDKYINEIKKKNIPIYLTGGERGKGYIPIKEVFDAYWTSKINLNFSRNGYNNEDLQIKTRIFGVCAAGGFLLTEYAPGVENYFKIGKEIVCFRNSEEMIDKIIYYLNHDEERRAIAKAGWERAIANYTSFHTLSKIFEEIENDVAASHKENNFHTLLKTPKRVRKNFSNHYFGWGLAFAMVGEKKLWKDALSLSLSYNRFNILTWPCYLIGFSPSFMRPVLFQVYKILYKIINLFI